MKATKLVASLLLLFNGMGALYGGLNLVAFPSGRSLDLSLGLLKYTPFNSYLIPGIILVIVNGLASIFVLSAILSNLKNNAEMVAIQGAILTGWILIQMILIRTVTLLHIILGTIGIVLMIIGYLESDSFRKKQKYLH